ncbi:aldehyde dehydrogenase [Mucilaginibacter sp. PPCGB 2223]|uniref:PA2169 family four-helix-bundle protein n=1 Tax=Mucilaginibacter sp. PPCGB 2223 TaxID=1886027 RepID=UPI000825BC2B|nr:PA2169 family four-helix-bundle protein [Mucilaginibacter sp. PPCGB 2223]OCX54659.1 aldehyde dehydrogenase [Mucilaginibacter sp. PPCGB 2223]
METKEATIDVLNDLVQINNDRIAGYERAIKEAGDENADLKEVFSRFIADSHQCKMELGTEIQALGEDMDTGSTTSGKIYRAWMEVKAVFTGNGRKAILESCEYGEDAAQRAYREALDDDELPAFLREIITRQQMRLRSDHDEIKAMRDVA